MGIRGDNPIDRIRRPKVPVRLPRPIGEENLVRALDHAPDRIRPWLYLAAFAGLRACEIAPLRGEDIHWSTTPPVIHVRDGKGGAEAYVPLAPVLADILAELPRCGWLFPRRDGSVGPVRAHLVSHLANDYLHSLSIWDTLHSLRHRFGTQVYRASGRDIRLTQQLLRHRFDRLHPVVHVCRPSRGSRRRQRPAGAGVPLTGGSPQAVCR